MPTKRVNPTDFFQLMAAELTTVTKQPFRDEPMTIEELNEISNRILALCEKEKEAIHDTDEYRNSTT